MLNMKSGRIAVLDGVRGIAILLVIVFHGSDAFLAGRHAGLFGRIAHEGGHLGVDVFFVLSGYLITSILVSEYTRTGRIDLGRFYRRRARRIFPAYYAFLALVGILAVRGVLHVPIDGWLLSVFYLTDYSFGHTAGWIIHSWSLAVEEQFYLFWPALIMFLGITRVRNFAFAVIVALPFVRLATYVFLPYQRPSIDVMLHTRLDMLMFGAAAAIAASQSAPVLERLAGRRGTTTALVSVAAIVCSVLVATRFHAAYLLTIGYSITGLCTATLLVCLLSHSQWRAVKLLGAPPFVALGRISYSLYLWQQLFLSDENHTLSGRFPLNFGAALLCAIASYYCIERPFLRPVPMERATLVPAPAQAG